MSPPCIAATCLKFHLSLVRVGLAVSALLHGELLLQTGVSPLLLCHGVPISVKLSDLGLPLSKFVDKVGGSDLHDAVLLLLDDVSPSLLLQHTSPPTVRSPVWVVSISARSS